MSCILYASEAIVKESTNLESTPETASTCADASPGANLYCGESLNIVADEGVYIWITYEASTTYARGEQEQLLCDLLQPLGLTHNGSGEYLGTVWRDIDFNVAVGTDLHVVRDALKAIRDFELIATLGQDDQEDADGDCTSQQGN